MITVSYEIEYVIPFEILFDGDFRDTWEAKDAAFSQEMENLLKLLNIEISPNMLAKEYCILQHGQGDVHVFFDSVKQKFIIFDLYFGYTDQHNMITLGVHVPLNMKEQVKKAMVALNGMVQMEN